jgi:hypothetical protein
LGILNYYVVYNELFRFVEKTAGAATEGYSGKIDWERYFSEQQAV